MERIVGVLKLLERVAMSPELGTDADLQEIVQACQMLVKCQGGVEARSGDLGAIHLSEDLPSLGGLEEPSWAIVGMRYAQVVMTRIGMAVGRVEWWDEPLSQTELTEHLDAVRAVLAEWVGPYECEWTTVRARAEQELAVLTAGDNDKSTAVLMGKMDEILERRPLEQRWLTIAQSSEYCGMGQGTIRNWIDSGELTRHNPTSGKVLVDRRELDSFIRSKTRRPAGGRGSGATFGQTD